MSPQNHLLKSSQNIHLIGIKGVGMTALAEILKNKGKKVSGSDTEEKFFTDKVLKKLKIPFKEGFEATNLSAKTDLIIHSTAYNPETHPEIQAGKQRKIAIITYPEAVAQLFNESLGVAVCGTHGKTTTSAILAVGLKKLGFDPTALIGSKVNGWGSNAISGKSPLLVIEADEHQDKLRLYNPWGIIMTNIDYDHPDFYPNEEAYFSSFQNFVERWKKSKTILTKILVLNRDDLKSQLLVKKLSLKNAKDMLVGEFGKNETPEPFGTGQAWEREEGKINFQIKIPANLLISGEEKNIDIAVKSVLIGEHNVANLSAAGTFLALFLVSLWKNKNFQLLFPREKTPTKIERFKTLVWLKTDLRNEFREDNWLMDLADLISGALASFSGTERRFELKGRKKNVLVYDDYAHHPQEIKATLEAVKQSFPKHQLFVLFHPHTFSRTKTFLNDFAKSLEIADQIGILEIYGSAREESGEVGSQDVLNLISPDKETHYFKTHKEALEFLSKCSFEKPTIFITMGAGDVWRVGEEYLG